MKDYSYYCRYRVTNYGIAFDDVKIIKDLSIAELAQQEYYNARSSSQTRKDAKKQFQRRSLGKGVKNERL